MSTAKLFFLLDFPDLLEYNEIKIEKAGVRALDFNEYIFLNIGLYLFAILVTLALLVGTAADNTPKRPFMKLFIALLADNIITLLGETGLWFFGGDIQNRVLLKISEFCAFGGGAVLIVLYSYCLLEFIREKTDKVHRIMVHINAGICGVYFILIIISLFNGMLFGVDENGCYTDGPLYWLVRVLDIVTMLIAMGIVISHHKALSLRGTLSLLSFSILPVAVQPLLLFWDATPLSIATTLSLIIMFILFQRETMQRLAQAEIKLAEKERNLTEQRIAAMISQIQPHFIYNTLGTICQLCLEQPEKAATLTQDFSQYLRGNFSELDNNKPILLSRELEHVKHYVNIEKVRFPDITVNFDVRCDDFFLPALSVQPLVENSIKHGLMGFESGGSVTVSAYETDKDYCVKVSDNGVGFDVNKQLDDKQHIGIKNIRERIETMCAGTLVVESVLGCGTTAVITIPKEAS